MKLHKCFFAFGYTFDSSNVNHYQVNFKTLLQGSKTTIKIQYFIQNETTNGHQLSDTRAPSAEHNFDDNSCQQLQFDCTVRVKFTREGACFTMSARNSQTCL